MRIRTRMCMSADGYVTTEGRPVQLADPAWDPVSFGFVEFQANCDAVLMGRTTFEPALGADEWPWKDVDVFVLGSHRPAGTPEWVVVESDPSREHSASDFPTAIVVGACRGLGRGIAAARTAATFTEQATATASSGPRSPTPATPPSPAGSSTTTSRKPSSWSPARLDGRSLAA